MVAQRDVRQRPGAFQADHARADAAQRKRHLVQVLARIFAIVGTPSPSARRARGLHSRGVLAVDRFGFSRRRSAQTTNRPHRGSG